MEPKTMLQSPENSADKGRTVPVARDASTPIEDDYHTIGGSNVKQYDTYSNRMAGLSDKLGWKDSVKG